MLLWVSWVPLPTKYNSKWERQESSILSQACIFNVYHSLFLPLPPSFSLSLLLSILPHPYSSVRENSFQASSDWYSLNRNKSNTLTIIKKSPISQWDSKRQNRGRLKTGRKWRKWKHNPIYVGPQCSDEDKNLNHFKENKVNRMQ